jgi:hypothetical protein
MRKAIVFFSVLATAQSAAASHQTDSVGVFRPASGEVMLSTSHTGSPVDEVYQMTVPGSAGFLFPVGGAFEEDDLHGVAVYNYSTRQFHIRYVHSDGPADLIFQFPTSGVSGVLYPVAGDWDGDGVDTIGVYAASTGTFYLRNSNSAGGANITQTITGVAGSGWRPVAGDWNGNGIDSIGAFNPTTRQFLLRNQHTSGPATYNFTFQGLPSTGTYYPIAGDWLSTDGLSRSMVGVYRQQNGRFYLRYQLSTGPADTSFLYGPAGGRLPIAGDWDGEALRFGIPLSAAGDGFRSFPHLVKRPGAPSLDFDIYYTALTSGGNEKLMFNHFQNDAWQFSQGQVVLQSDGAVAMGTVLISATNVFRSPAGPSYKRLTYYIYEPPTKPPGELIAGWVCLMYSNDGLSWTPPVMATTNSASSPPPCTGNGSLTEQVPAEMVGAFRDTGDLWLAVMNGRVQDLIDGALMETKRTETDLYSSVITQPWVISREGEFSPQGIERPNTGGRWNHGYGINLDFTYNPDDLSVYFTRVYPYPLDFDPGFPCNNPSTPPSCNTGLTALPVRAQIYKMPVPGGTVKEFLNGTWQLVADYGASVGYRDDLSSVCESTPLAFSFQEALGLDIDSIKFYKDHNGQIGLGELGARYLIFGGGPKTRVYGNCNHDISALYVLPVDF